MSVEKPDEPPLTQQELEHWVGEVEDKAWMASSQAFAADFLLGNLLSELHASGLIRAPAFIQRLQEAVASGKYNLDAQQAFGVKGTLDRLALFFAGEEGSGGTGSQGGVFH